MKYLSVDIIPLIAKAKKKINLKINNALQKIFSSFAA
jgi:hypothetical protein